MQDCLLLLSLQEPVYPPAGQAGPGLDPGSVRRGNLKPVRVDCRSECRRLLRYALNDRKSVRDHHNVELGVLQHSLVSYLVWNRSIRFYNYDLVQTGVNNV